MPISFSYIFGNMSGWEMLTGLSGDVISGITLGVLVFLFLLDVIICCGGCCLLCCLCYIRKRRQNNIYTLKRVERTSHSFAKSTRLSHVSNSTIGDMEWVQGKNGSLVVNKNSTEENNLCSLRESPSELVYEEPDDKVPSHTRSSGYVVMSRLDNTQYDDSNNYDDITNTDSRLYDDVMNALPNLNPDAGTYDDVKNVRGLGTDVDYEDVMNIQQPKMYNSFSSAGVLELNKDIIF